MFHTLKQIWPTLWPTLAAIGVLLAFVPLLGLYMTFIERKLAAYVQDRVGPNRVGPFGLFQAIADGIKIFLKVIALKSPLRSDSSIKMRPSARASPGLRTAPLAA